MSGIAVEWTGGQSNLGYTGSKFNPGRNHCFNSLSVLGKLSTTNVYPLDPAEIGYLVKYSVPGIVLLLIQQWAYAPQSGDDELLQVYQVRYKGTTCKGLIGSFSLHLVLKLEFLRTTFSFPIA